MMKGMSKYECEEDARSLMRAHEVMSDSKRHGKAQGQLKKLHGDRKREALHAKAAQGLRKAFPDDATAGKTKSDDVYVAAKAKKAPNRKLLGKTKQGLGNDSFPKVKTGI